MLRTTLCAFFLTLIALPVDASAAGETSVWLVSNGFHSSIAIRTADLSPRLRQLAGNPDGRFLVIGWGAAIYYTAPKVTPVVCCRATLLPTPSALHIITVDQPIRVRFPNSDVFRLTLSANGKRNLQRFMEDAFRLDAAGRSHFLGTGKVPRGRFYSGRETFWFPGTCNVWSARALHQAGLPFVSIRSIAASGLSRQAGKLGTREARRKRPLDAF